MELEKISFILHRSFKYRFFHSAVVALVGTMCVCGVCCMVCVGLPECRCCDLGTCVCVCACVCLVELVVVEEDAV